MSSSYMIRDDDGTCQAVLPGDPAVRCLRKAGHDGMHDGPSPDGLMGHMWPKEDDPDPSSRSSRPRSR